MKVESSTNELLINNVIHENQNGKCCLEYRSVSGKNIPENEKGRLTEANFNPLEIIIGFY